MHIFYEYIWKMVYYIYFVRRQSPDVADVVVQVLSWTRCVFSSWRLRAVTTTLRSSEMFRWKSNRCSHADFVQSIGPLFFLWLVKFWKVLS